MPSQNPPLGVPASQAGAPPSQKNVALILVTSTVMIGMIMAIVDSTIVNVALDKMAGNLGPSMDEVAWVATAYILSNVIVMPLNGWLTAVFGRRNFYAARSAI